MELLKSLDFLSPTKTLNVNRRDRVKSLPGAVTSVIYVLLLVLMIVVLILQYLKTDSPGINHQEESSEVYTTVNLVSTKQMPVFLFYSDEGYIEYSKVAKLFDIYGNKKNYTVKHGQNFSYTSDGVSVSPISCGTLMAETDYFKGVEMSQSVRESLRTSGVCFDTRNATLNELLTVNGTGTDQYYDVMNFYIDPCTSSMDCQAISNFAIDSLRVYRGSIRQLVDTKNYEDPVKEVFNLNQYFLLSSSSRLVNTFEPVQTIVEDELGAPYAKREVDRATNLDRTQALYLPATGQLNSYFKAEVTASNTRYRITRTYPTIIGTLATFGGIKEIIVIVLTLLVSTLFSKSIEKEIVEQIFHFKQDKEVHESFVCKDLLNETPSSAKPRTKGCLCCKKARKSEVYEKKILAATDLIEQNLDVVTIVNKLNTLTILSKLILSETDELLVPPTALTMHQLSKTEKRLRRNLRFRMRRSKPVKPSESPKVVAAKEIYTREAPPSLDKPKMDEENPPISCQKPLGDESKMGDGLDPESVRIKRAPDEPKTFPTSTEQIEPKGVLLEEVSSMMKNLIDKELDLSFQEE